MTNLVAFFSPACQEPTWPIAVTMASREIALKIHGEIASTQMACAATALAHGVLPLGTESAMRERLALLVVTQKTVASMVSHD